MKLTNDEILSGLARLVIYRGVGEGAVLRALADLLAARESGACANTRARHYASFLAALYPAGGDLGLYLGEALAADDNFHVRRVAAGLPVSREEEDCFMAELGFFSRLSTLTPALLFAAADLSLTLPRFSTTPADFTCTVPARLAAADQYGYGMYARHGMFRVSNEGKILPIPSPDPVTLEALVGYEEERGQVLANTRTLLAGGPAANLLLCGDAGTGKSATVKAVANRFFLDGLRLIELRKEQLPLLPEVMGELAGNPLRFILFVDDLSFSCDDDGYAALKAVLEGSAAARVPNAVIYATSNRRHLVRETFSAREGDEVHRNDTLEEMLSLSARFGMTVLFSKPAKSLYLRIARTLAEERGITPDADFDIRAEAFALGKGGRSARTAGQFVDSLFINENL